MTSQIQESHVRNPFGVMDVPNPNDAEVVAFATQATLAGAADDDNAPDWGAPGGGGAGTIEGRWSSRWNGGADPTIPGDVKDNWKQGRAELKRPASASTCCSPGITASAAD